MKNYKVAPDLKEQILNRIKNEGVSVLQASKDHGISKYMIYKWLGAGANSPTYAEVSKLRRENKILLELVGEITLKLSESQKKS
jgi:transposase-like protein